MYDVLWLILVCKQSLEGCSTLYVTKNCIVISFTHSENKQPEKWLILTFFEKITDGPAIFFLG